MLAQLSIFLLFGPWLLYSLDSSYVRGLTLLLPWLGALVVWFLPSEQIRLTRQVALIVTLITFCISICLWATFDYSHAEPFQKVRSIQLFNDSFISIESWKGYFNLNLEFGLDGRSLWMVLLTTALFPICVLCSWQLPAKSVGRYIRQVCNIFLIIEVHS